MQTKQRQMVKDRFKQLIEHYEQNGYELPPPVNDLFLQLAEQLKSVRGKKVYGYLPKEVKETVDKIVVELAKDKDIAELYSKWNEINREKLSLYSEKKTPDIPLENNKEFRSIKNVIIKAAVEFNNTQHIDYYTPRHYTVSLFCRIVCELLCAISRSYNDRDEKLGYRIREAQMKKIPYQLVLGNQERDEKTVTYREYGHQKQTTLPVDDFIAMIEEEVRTKALHHMDEQ